MRAHKTLRNLVRSTLCTVLTACWLAGAPASAQEGRGPKPGANDQAAELTRQAVKLYEAARYDEAIALTQEALAIRENLLGEMHPDVAESLNNLATVHIHRGEYDKALPLIGRSLAIREKALGHDHPDTAESLNTMAGLHYARGEYDKALLLLERASSVREKALGPDHPDTAESLNNLAVIYEAKGEYDMALPLYERVLTIWRNALGSDHAEVAQTLNNLAQVHYFRGEYDKALLQHERALAIREKALGPDHPHVAQSLDGVGGLHYIRREYDKALPLHERALVIREKALGPHHPHVAQSLHNLAQTHLFKGEYDEALPLHERALAIREKALGPDHPHVAGSLEALAALHQVKREYAEALSLYERALAIREKALGPDHPHVARTLNSLAVLHQTRGEYDKALQLHERALIIRGNTLGHDHPNMAQTMNNLAFLQAACERIPAAIELFERAARIRTRMLGQWLHNGSEDQWHRRMVSFTRNVHGRVSFHLTLAPSNPRASNLSITSILSFKSRILDAMADTMRIAHMDAEHPDTHALLDQLRDVHSALSHLYLQSPGSDQASRERYRRRRAKLESRIDELQARLSARSETYRRLARPVTVATVQERLPRDAALLEFFVYKPRDFKATGLAALDPWGEPRYAAYIVRPGDQVYGVDIGPAEVIDEAVTRMRESFARYSKDAHERARELDTLVMQPVREHLGDATRIYVSPAGQLGFVPFAALVDERGRYLIERYSFTYLASGRDLVQGPRSTDAPAREAQPVTIVAAPSYGLSSVTDALANTSAAEVLDTASKHHRSRDAKQIGQAKPLPGTRREAEILRALLPRSVVWTQAAATESAVKSVQSPRILHLATHGFFLEDQDLEAMADFSPNDMPLQAGIYGRLGVRGYRAPVENGLLRSGLLLAGANQLRDPAGDNDGVLTALEVSAMNLAGTQLVVLSACDTGIGEDGPDQGVYGLRRAFAIAGAQTLVMSLWKVDDNATQDLMARYYRYLLAGEGRAEAMRRVQLDYLAQGGARAHPYYWAAFVVSGDDSTLAGEPPRLATVRAGGCAGCSTGAAGAGGPWSCVLALMAVSSMRRRKRMHSGPGRE